MHTPAPSAELMRVLRFNTADLEENRAGRLSSRQRQQIVQARRWQTLTNGLMIGAAAGLGVSALALEQFCLGGLICGIGSILAFLVWRQHQQTRTLLSHNTVFSVRGTLHLVRRPQSLGDAHIRSSVSRAEIGSMAFDISPGVRKALRDGGDYTLYYVAPFNALVAAERHDLPVIY